MSEIKTLHFYLSVELGALVLLHALQQRGKGLISNLSTTSHLRVLLNPRMLGKSFCNISGAGGWVSFVYRAFCKRTFLIRLRESLCGVVVELSCGSRQQCDCASRAEDCLPPASYQHTLNRRATCVSVFIKRGRKERGEVGGGEEKLRVVKSLTPSSIKLLSNLRRESVLHPSCCCV